MSDNYLGFVNGVPLVLPRIHAIEVDGLILGDDRDVLPAGSDVLHAAQHRA